MPETNVLMIMCPGRALLIAEAGVNHNGDLDKALALVDAAADAGADAVKFQTFKAEKLLTKTAGKAEYLKRFTGGDEGQQAMIRRLELNEDAHLILLERCAERGIQFLSSAGLTHFLNENGLDVAFVGLLENPVSKHSRKRKVANVLLMLLCLKLFTN